MILELRKKSQVTIPQELVKQLGLKEGDKLDISIQDGKLIIVPVVVYPKEELTRIAKLIKEAEGENGKIYDNVSEAFKDMGINTNEL